VILGEEKAILDIIKAKGRGKSINTSYVESRNGNYRKDNKRLARKTQANKKSRYP
jgi:IS1 family transposase